MQLLKNSKIWLLFRYLCVIILISTSVYCYNALNNNKYQSKYKGDEKSLTGYITSIKIDGNKVNISLKAREKVIIQYYLKTKKEKEIFEVNYDLGDNIYIKGSMEKPPFNRVFNLFNYNHYLLSHKVYWLFNVTEIKKISDNSKTRYKIKNIIINRINSIKKSSSYLKAFILGDDADISASALKSYQVNGVNHLLAISGMHITLLSGVILIILNNIYKNKIINYIITIILLLFYLFIIDFPPSAIRATLLFLLLTINKIFKLNIPTIYYLFLLASLLLLYNPFYLYHLGFIFSFVICFYLILFQSLINTYRNYVVKIFIVSLISFLASIPIIINNFFQINLISPLINVVFVPYVSLIIFPLSLLVFICPFLDNILKILINILEGLSSFFSNIDLFIIVLGKIPSWGIIIYYFIITLVLVMSMKKKYYSFIILLFIIVFHSNVIFFNNYPKLTIIDVGQGDSILIELPHNKGNILIDTGGITRFNNEKWTKAKNEFSIGTGIIIPYLKSLGIKKLDYLIITHGDNDHIGAAAMIVNNYPVDRVIFNSGQDNYNELSLINILKTKNIPYYRLNQYILEINSLKFYFLNTKNFINENEDSLIIYTKLNNKNILLTGDAGKISEAKFLNEYKLPKMDILKIGHHGSKNSTSDKLLERINPTLALISVGKKNRFNHPSSEVIDKLQKRQIQYYLTSINGTIKLILRDKIVVYTCL